MNAMQPEPTPAEDVESNVMVECPICGEISLQRHCKSAQCRWKSCKNRSCDATLDWYKGTGQYRHPQGEVDKVTRMTKRVYLVLDQRGVWRERVE